MKQFLTQFSLLLASSAILLGLSAGTASAHVLKEDHAISAVLHMPPDDNPAAGQDTELDISFGDPNDTFSLQDCDCKVTVRQNSKIITAQPARPALDGATLDSLTKVRFPAVGVYNVLVDGKSKDGKFSTFHLDYLVRVQSSATSGTESKAGQGSQVAIIAAGSLAVLGLFAYTNMSSGGRYVTAAAKDSKATKKVKKE